jgi:Family of unknown function (DUF6600)
MTTAWRLQFSSDMKTRLIILAVGIAGGLSLGLFRASADLEVSAGVSIHSTAEFYRPLASLGTWVNVDPYGRCWHPTGVSVGWRPYCNGHWEWTDCGWYWASDEPWAWACYHYGSWVDDSKVGWCWVPGVEWAPAWVTWRIGGDYIGWAPCDPSGAAIAPSSFVFVESQHFGDLVRPDIVIVNNTLVFNKTTRSSAVRRENRKFDSRAQSVMVNEGPRLETVEKATGRKLSVMPVREANRQTSASIPKQLKRETDEPAKTQRPASAQEQPTRALGHNFLTPDGKVDPTHRQPPNPKTPAGKMTHGDKTTPQVPPKKTIPPPNNGASLNKNNLSPKGIAPPQDLHIVSVTPG